MLFYTEDDIEDYVKEYAKKIREKTIDEFLDLLISETCENCRICEPRLSAEFNPRIACSDEGYVKWYIKLANQLKEVKSNDGQRM